MVSSHLGEISGVDWRISGAADATHLGLSLGGVPLVVPLVILAIVVRVVVRVIGPTLRPR